MEGEHSDVRPEGDPAEIEGIAPRADADLQWMPAGGGDARLIGSAQGGHAPHFAGDGDRIFFSTRKGLSSIRLDGFDRREVVRITGKGPGPNPPSAEEIRMAPDGGRPCVSLQNRHAILGSPTV